MAENVNSNYFPIEEANMSASTYGERKGLSSPFANAKLGFRDSFTWERLVNTGLKYSNMLSGFYRDSLENS